MSVAIIKKVQGAYFPHWTADAGVYFVTFRLAGSVPACVKQERELLRKEIFSHAEKQRRDFTVWEREILRELNREQWRQKRHDRGLHFLRDPRIAKITADAFMHFEGTRYRLFAWCVMSTHVHVVFQPLGEWTVPSILQSWKRYSARKANLVLGRTGQFWRAEYYDHLIRNNDDLQRCIEYTWENPEQAGLKNHQWRWRHDRILSRLTKP